MHDHLKRGDKHATLCSLKSGISSRYISQPFAECHSFLQSILCACSEAVLLQRPGFDSRPVHVGFMVNKIGTGTGLSPSALVFAIILIQPLLNTHLSLIYFCHSVILGMR